nr:hypothetical protein [Candidatus Sigynarchaeum springense]
MPTIPGWFVFDGTGNPLPPDKVIWNIAEFGIFVILIVFGIYFLRLYIKARKENPVQAPFNLGYTIFFFTQSLNQVFFIPSAFSPELNTYLGWEIHLYILDNDIYPLNMQIGYMFLLFDISFLCILLPFEKYIKNSKRYPISVMLLLGIAMSAAITILGNIHLDAGTSGDAAFFAVVGIVHPIGAIIILAAFLIAVIGALVLYFRLSAQTSGALRKKSAATAIGLLVWMLSVIVGNAMRTQFSEWGIVYGDLIGPALFYVGTFLLAYGFKR